jgi:hypothetical protein
MTTKEVRHATTFLITLLSFLSFLHSTEEGHESVCAEIGQLARQCKFFFVGGSFVWALEYCS